MGKKFKIPIFTSGTNQIAALKALKIKSFVGVGYDFEDTSIVVNYFTAAGFDVLGIDRLPVPWEEVGRLSSTEVYHHVKRLFLNHRDADGIYFQGGKLRILDIIEMLEEDLQVRSYTPEWRKPGRSKNACMCGSLGQAMVDSWLKCRRVNMSAGF